MLTRVVCSQRAQRLMTARWTSACCAQALQVCAGPRLVLHLLGGLLQQCKLQGLRLEPRLLSWSPDWHGPAILLCHEEARGTPPPALPC